LAVKIVRQPNKIALIGVPTSAGSHGPGVERAPAALRAAGLVERLREAGCEVTDLGDCPTQLYQPDEERPRMRNIDAVLAALTALKPLVEQATKSGALALILGGDCTITVATIAGIRRYYRAASLVWLDRDADLNVPATSPSGCLHGMVVAHITGRGAPELVRFWGEPPLVREPELALFGLDRLDPPEQALLERAPIRRYTAADAQRRGVAACAGEALDRIHARTNPFVLHFDVDAISSDEFPAVDFPASGGLSLEEVRQALDVFAAEKNLAALEVAEYNPERDPDGSAARRLVDLLADVLAARMAALTADEAREPAKAEAPVAAEAAPPSEMPAPAAATPGVETAAGEPPSALKTPEEAPAAAGEASSDAPADAEPAGS
jgi:arginase